MSDNVHPLDAGHTSYCQLLTKGLAQMLKQSVVRDRVLPAPLVRDRYFDSTLQLLPREAENWTWIDLQNKGGWDCFDGLLTADQPGAELTLTFTGKLVGLYYQLGPDTGNLHYRIDDGPEKLLEPFDKHASNCTRPRYCVLDDALNDSEHQIHLRVAESKDKKSKGTWTRLAYLMVG